jgi:GTP-binding protein
MDLLDRAAVSYGLVLTKADELKTEGREAARAAAAAEAARHTAALAAVSLTSALDGTGLAELRTGLAALAQ